MTLPLAMTITEFCRAHRISRPTFYVWAKAGKAPETIAIGGKRLISVEAAADWRKRMSMPVYSGTNTCG